MTERTWFVSDVHIHYGDGPYLERFLEFLEAARRTVRHLYVIGDLFEFWIGDRQASFGFYRPLFERLGRLVQDGVAVHVVHGNRDFLIGSRFSEIGVELMPDEFVLDLAGRRVHVSHGDQFCIHDRSYQRARTAMRSRGVRALAACLPAAVGVFLAKAYRGISERKKGKMSAVGGGNRFHTIRDGVLQLLRDSDLDVVICGHIHLLQDIEVEVGGRQRRIITTGAWEDAPNYVDFDGRDLALKRF